jgi:hypothetical protein
VWKVRSYHILQCTCKRFGDSYCIVVFFHVVLYKYYFSWNYFPHDHARSRVYRWGEDGLLGITDRQCRLCVGLALWNGKDAILKERLFGLTGPQVNHRL